MDSQCLNMMTTLQPSHMLCISPIGSFSAYYVRCLSFLCIRVYDIPLCIKTHTYAYPMVRFSYVWVSTFLIYNIKYVKITQQNQSSDFLFYLIIITSSCITAYQFAQEACHKKLCTKYHHC